MNLNTHKNGDNENIPIKPYKQKELCNLYNVHRNTFKNWLKPFEEEIGERQGYYYSIKQVEIIFKRLDYPSIYRGSNNSNNKEALEQ
ncbi:MAG TPA: hypothetical protein VK808_03870 [Bacteroidia bacterium]|nr:hypothetical protein [Bacteroidia bacterium]